jgi:hypothetical protein
MNDDQKEKFSAAEPEVCRREAERLLEAAAEKLSEELTKARRNNKMTKNNTPKLDVRCPKCGSDDIQVESCLAEDGTALEWGGFYCIGCGYFARKAAAGDDVSEISNTPVRLEVHQLCARAEVAFCQFMESLKADVVSSKPTDIGGWELKIRTDHSAELAVRKGDVDDRKAVLMTTTDGRTFCIRGWINVKEAKAHPKWLG